MNIVNNETYNNQIYKAIVVNENYQNDPQNNGRVQIYIPSMQPNNSSIYEQYMNTSNKESSQYYNQFPWAVTLVKDLTNGNIVYGNFIDNDYSQFIILGLQANISENETLNIIGNNYNLSGDSLTQYTTAIIIENEVGLSYNDYLNNNIADENYTHIECDDNGAFSIGLIQWHANNAFDILLKIKNELSNWDTYWEDKDLYIYKDLNRNSAINNNYNTYTLTKDSQEYNSIKSMLGSDKGKEVQLKHSSDFAYSYITDLQNNYNISNPAVVIWLADFMNQYGPNITNTKRKAAEICNSTSDNIQALDQLIEWCEQNYESYNKYKNRRNNTRAFIKDLESQGKLSANGLIENGYNLVGINSSYCYPFIGSASVNSTWGPGRNVGQGGYSKSPHNGVDFGVPKGTPLYACANGRIEHKGSIFSGGFGLYTLLYADDGNLIIYAHQSRHNGDDRNVTKGELIGYSGNTGNSTGPHLHIGITDQSNGESGLYNANWSIGKNPLPFFGLNPNEDYYDQVVDFS